MLETKTLEQLKFHYQHYQTILPRVKRRAQGIVQQQLSKLQRLIAGRLRDTAPTGRFSDLKHQEISHDRWICR